MSNFPIDSFVIDAEMREQLIEEDPKSANIIKPVLVGSGVDRYEINFAQRYLIWTYIGVDISQYPAIAQHLSQYRDQLERRWDKGNHWYELRTCTYYDEFERPKIIYPDIAATCRFAYDDSGFFSTNTTYFIPCQDLYLLSVLNSSLSYFYLNTHCAALEDAKRRAWLRFFGQYMELFPVRCIEFTTPEEERRELVEVEITEATEFIEHTEGAASVSFSAFSASVFGRWLDARLTADPEQSDVVHDLLAYLAEQMIEMHKEKQAEARGFLDWLADYTGLPIDDWKLKTYVRAYWEHHWSELQRALRQNRRRMERDVEGREARGRIKREFEDSMAKLRPLLARIEATDRLIDQIVYRLYGLTEEEIAVVEGRSES